MTSRCCILGLLFVLVAACSSSATKTSKSTPAPHKSLSARLDEKNGYKVDSDGNWVPTNDRRSSFENKGASPYFKGNYDKKTYQTQDYAKKSWWGNKDYKHKDYAVESNNGKWNTKSRLDGVSARESATQSGLTKNYATGTYATSAAREAGKEGIKKTTDAATENRRNLYTPPEIIDWKQQRSMDVEQSKGILGR